VPKVNKLKQECGFMHLSSASPKGGGPRADVGEYGDFMGTLQQNFWPCGGGNVGT